MNIVQGGNAPIILIFDEDMTAYKSISIGLYKPDGENVKQWTMDELIFDNTRIVCPLDPDETKDFYTTLVLSVKVMSEDGKIFFYKELPLVVSKRMDREVEL